MLLGVLTAWAWGFSRILDAIIEEVPEFDQKRVGVIGCSRDGKSALGAGIFDERVGSSLLLRFILIYSFSLISLRKSDYLDHANVKRLGGHCSLALPISRA